jgi:hypothetical protein
MSNKTLTKDKLASALRFIELPAMADKAAAGYYDDFLSPLDMPIMQLVRDLTTAGTPAARALAQRVMNGEFDATKEEAETWANSAEGQATFRKLKP